MPDKVVLVGQAPSASGADRFEGRSGARLATLAELSRADFLATFERVNLLPFAGKDGGKGDAFDASAARLAAGRLAPSLAGRRVVLVGLAVAKAFGLDEPPLLSWTVHRGMNVAVVPHPSGVNRWWNEPTNVAMAKAFLRELAAQAQDPATT